MGLALDRVALVGSQESTVVVVNSTVETTILGPFNLKARTLNFGGLLEMVGWGTIKTDDGGQSRLATIRFKETRNGVTQVLTSQIAEAEFPANLSNLRVEAALIPRREGSLTKIAFALKVWVPESAGAREFGVTGSGDVAFDFLSDTFFEFTAQWTDADPNNELKMFGGHAESYGGG